MNKAKIAILTLLVCLVVFAVETTVFAQEQTTQTNAGVDYIPLAPIPGLSTKVGETSTTNTETFLPGLFKLIIALSSALAVVMLLYGGIQYMTTDAWNKKDTAKETIKNALVGLMLTLSSYLIVYTINPNMLKFDLKMQQLGIPEGPLTVGETDGLPSENSGSCTDCVKLTVPGKTASQNGCSGAGFCQVDRNLNSKLVNMHSKTPIYVTEAYPPTREHQSGCHSVGTCVDIRTVSDNQVHNVITAAQSSGLKAVFEVETEARKNAVITASCNRVGAASNCRSVLGESIAVLPPKDGKRQINAEHFSIYNQ